MSWTASEAIGAEQPPFTTDRQTGVVDLLPLNSHFGVYWQPFDHRMWSRIRIAPWPPQSEGQHSSDLLYAVGVRRAVDLLMRSFTRSESLSLLSFFRPYFQRRFGMNPWNAPARYTRSHAHMCGAGAVGPCTADWSRSHLGKRLRNDNTLTNCK